MCCFGPATAVRLAFWGFLLFALLHLFPPLPLFVTHTHREASVSPPEEMAWPGHKPSPAVAAQSFVAHGGHFCRPIALPPTAARI